MTNPSQDPQTPRTSDGGTPHPPPPNVFAPPHAAPPTSGAGPAPAPTQHTPLPHPGAATGGPPSSSVPAAQAPVRGRTPWLALVGTATAAAVAASLTTAGLTGAFGPAEPDAGTPAPQQRAEEERTSVPVAGSSSALPDWEAVAGAVRPSVVAIDVRTGAGGGTGSGVVIDREGHVLTNDHVVGAAVDGGLRVTLADGRVLEAEIVGLDPTTDLAVIRLVDAPDDLTPAQVGSSAEVEVGEAVMAVGNPLGLDSTATTGIVSAVDRPVSTSDGRATVVTNAIQIDAAINPGNSGGPLFDAAGAVIGITSSIATDGSSNGSIGLGFAIPSDLASRIAEELIADGSAEHAFLGVGLSDGAAEADGTARRGAKVEQVSEDSPAGAAGIQVGDVITAIDGDPVSGAESLTAHVREHGAGETAVLSVVRDGEPTEVTVTFAVRQEDESSDQGGQPGSGQPGGQGQGEPGQGEWGQGEPRGPGGAPGGGFPWEDFLGRG